MTTSECDRRVLQATSRTSFEQQEFYSAASLQPSATVAAVPAPPMTTVEHKHGSVLAPLAVAPVPFKLFLLFFTPASGQLLGRTFHERGYYGNFHWPLEQPPTGATRFATWDAQHYLFLATEGYHAGQRSITFFPLFPWLIRATAALPGVGPLGAALLL